MSKKKKEKCHQFVYIMTNQFYWKKRIMRVRPYDSDNIRVNSPYNVRAERIHLRGRTARILGAIMSYKTFASLRIVMRTACHNVPS